MLTVLRTAVITCTLATATAAVADPIHIQSGGLSYTRQNLASFGFVVVGGELQGEFGVLESMTPAHACFPCTSGATINLSVSEDLGPYGSDTEPGVFGGLRFNGLDYAITALRFRIDADDATIPPLPQENARTALVRFTFDGAATGSSGDGSDVITLMLRGSGRAAMFFTENEWFASDYQFDDPAAVPEPASLLLIGTGIAGLAARRRRLRRLEL